MSQQIIDVLNALCEKFGIAIDWTAENIMPYLEQLGSRIVKYEIYSSGVWIGIGILMFIAMFIAAAVCIRGYRLEQNELVAFDWLVGGSIICAILFSLSMSMILSQIFDIIQACTIPELTIIDLIKPYLQ